MPTADTVAVREWPRIPPEEREVAQVIAARVAQMRGAEPPSVLHEERLEGDVELVIHRAIESPRRAACRWPPSRLCPGIRTTAPWRFATP